MTKTQQDLAIREAASYADVDAFVSDLLTSSAFLDLNDEAAQPDLSEIDALRTIWTVVRAPFRELLAAMQLSQSACSRRFWIPLRTVQGWAGETRACPPYVRLMMAELTGLLTL